MIVALVAAFAIGQVSSPVKLGSYTPAVTSASGFSQSIATSTTLAANSFCDPTNIQFLNTTALATTTFAAATSSYAACTNLTAFGASVNGSFVNDSTNTIAFAPGTGDVFKCETGGAGTSTVAGTCTASAFSILASSTVSYSMFFDTASSSLVVLVGNNYK